MSSKNSQCLSLPAWLSAECFFNPSYRFDVRDQPESTFFTNFFAKARRMSDSTTISAAKERRTAPGGASAEDKGFATGGNSGERAPGISWCRLVAGCIRRLQDVVALQSASRTGVSSTITCLSRHAIGGGCARSMPCFVGLEDHENEYSPVLALMQRAHEVFLTFS